MLVEEQRALLVIMITTGEALIDPVAFVKENHEALNIDDQHGQEIVSGLDFDVLIDRYGSLPKKKAATRKNRQSGARRTIHARRGLRRIRR